MSETSEGGGSGVGVSANVVLKINLDKSALTEKTNTTVTDSVNQAIKGLHNRSNDLTNATAPIGDLITQIQKGNTALRNNPETNKLILAITQLDTALGIMARTKGTADFGKASSAVSEALHRILASAKRLGPALEYDGKSSRKAEDSREIQGLIKLLDSKKGVYNNSVQNFSDSLGRGPANQVTDTGETRRRMVNTSNMLHKGYVAEENEVKRHIGVLEGQSKAIKKVYENLRAPAGMALDIETANFSRRNSMWAVATKIDEGETALTQRKLSKADGLTPFHANYAKGLAAEGSYSKENMLLEVYRQYASTAANGDLKGDLPPLIGHNNLFDIKQIYANSQGFKDPKIKELRNAMKRLMPGGDSEAVGQAGDTARMFANFMQKDMGYRNFLGPGQAGAVGNTLGAASAAFGFNLTAHDPASDTEATSFLARMLSSDKGRVEAKKLFNKDDWEKQTRLDTYDQFLRTGIKETYGEQYLNIAQTNELPPELESSTPLGVVRSRARYGANYKVDERIADYGYPGETARVYTPNQQAIAETQRNSYDAAAEASRNAITAAVEKRMFSQTTLPGGEYRRAIEEVVKSPNIAKTLAAVAAASGSKQPGLVTEQLANDVIDSYVGAGQDATKPRRLVLDPLDSALAYAPGDQAAYIAAKQAQDMQHVLNGTFAAGYNKYAAYPQIEPNIQHMAQGDLRLSSLAQTYNDVGGRGGSKTMDDLKRQMVESFDVQAPPRGATYRGDDFEPKAIAELIKNPRYTVTKTGKDQTTLSLGKHFTGHPDGFLYDSELNGGTGSVLEAKYRGLADQRVLEQGKIPRSFVAQASAYAFAAGMPDLPTTFLTGDAVPKNEATDRIDAELRKGVDERRRAELVNERDKITDAMHQKDYRVENLRATTVMPDKGMQDSVAARIQETTGEKIDLATMQALDPKVIEHLSGGKTMDPKELAIALKEAATKVKAVANASSDLVIAEENFGKNIKKAAIDVAEQKNAETGEVVGNIRVAEKWNPDVSSTKEEKLVAAEKLYEGSKKKLRDKELEKAGIDARRIGKAESGFSSAETRKLDKEESDDAATEIEKEKVRAQGLKASLNKLRTGAIADSAKELSAEEKITQEFRTQLSLEKDNMMLARQRLAIKLRADGGKYATSRDIQQATNLNLGLKTFHGVDDSATNVMDQAELDQLARNRGLERPNLSGGGAGGGGVRIAGAAGGEQGGGKARSGKDFVGGAVDLLDWQIQWMAGVTVLNAISGAFKNSIGFAIEFEAMLKNVQLITQANTAEMDKLTTGVEELATTFQYSATEISQGLIILGQAGFDATESLKILPSITALATATLSDLKTVTDITTTALRAFNLPVAKAAEVANVLAAMTIESKLSIDKLGTSFNYIASTASAAGFTLEETGTAMGLMANAGVRASTIGTTLRSVTGSLLHPTKKFQAALAAAGLSARDISPTYNSLGDIFKKLKAAGFDVESAFEGLDKRIAGGAITLIRSADQFDYFRSSITGTSRAFTMAHDQMATFQAQTKRMRNIGQLIGAEVFKSSLGPLTNFSSLFSDLLEKVLALGKALPDVVKTSVAGISSMTVGLSLAGGVGKGLWDIRKNLKAALADEAVKFPDGTPGDTLKGRNKQVHSLLSTFFNKKVLITAVAVAAAAAAVMWAYDEMSGKAQMVRDARIKDVFTEESKAMDLAVKSYKEAITSTQDLVIARKELKELGVVDLSAKGLDSAQAIAARHKKEATSTAFASYMKYATGEKVWSKDTREDPKNIAAAVMQYLKDQRLYYTGTPEQQYNALDARGVTLEGDARTQFKEELANSRLDSNLPALRRGEAEQALRDATRDRRSLDTEVASTAAQEALALFLKAHPELSQTEGIDPRAKWQTSRSPQSYSHLSLARLKKAAKEEKQYTIDTEKNSDEALAAASDAYMLYAINTKYEYVSETTRALESKQAQNMQLKQEKIDQLATYEGDPRFDVAAIQTKRDLEAVIVALKAANRKLAVRQAFKGADNSQVYEELSDYFLDYLKDADTGRLKEGSVESFGRLSSSKMVEMGKKLKELKTAQNVTRVSLQNLFKDNILPDDVAAALDGKFALEQQALWEKIQKEQFAPQKKLYDSLITQTVATSTNLKGNTSYAAGNKDFQLQLAVAKEVEKGLKRETVFGLDDSISRFGGYDKAGLDIRTEQTKLEERIKLNADLASLDAKSLEDSYNLKIRAFHKENGELLHLSTTKKQEFYKIELAHSKKVLDLSRKATAEQKKDINSLISLKEKQLNNLNSWKSDRASVVGGFDETVRNAKDKLYPRSRRENVRRDFTEASASSYVATKALRDGDR